ncbi:MAG: DUF2306 domain-containing protein [Pirellulaceae bacterium]
MLCLLFPSGLVMAYQAYAGPPAAAGFGILSLLTAAAALMTAYHARARNFALHRRWAERCFLLLISPLILRLIAGAVIVMDVESELTYRLNAWLSWLVPLGDLRNAAVTEKFRSPTIVDHCSGRGYESLA